MKKNNFFSKAISLKTIAIVLTLCCILSSFAGMFTVSAANYTAQTFVAGDGTAENPYLISTPNQLYKMVEDSGKNSEGTAAYYKLINDIDLDSSKNWANSSITTAFMGNLDGDGYSINNLYAWGAKATLINYFDNSAVIKNLTVDGAYCKGSAYASALVGVMVATTETPATVNFENVTVRNSTIISEAQTYGNVGHGAIVASVTEKESAGGSAIVMNNCKAVNVSISKTKTPSGVTTPAGYLVGRGQIGTTGTLVTGTNCAAYGCSGANWIFGGRHNHNGGHNGTNGVIADYYAENYASGTGTKNDPYHIENEHQLFKMVSEDGMKDGAKAYFVLDNDIALNNTENWAPDAANTNGYRNWNPTSVAFVGDLNGRGYTISGLYVNVSTDAGAFIRKTDNASAVSIENVTFKNNYVKAANNAAVVAAYGSGTTFSYVTVINTTIGGAAVTSGTLYANFSVWNDRIYSNNCSVINSNAAYIIGGHSSNKYHNITNCWGVDCTSANLCYDGDREKVTDSYVISDSSTIKGEAASTAMPALDYTYIWKIGGDDEYPSLRPFSAETVWDGTQETIATTTMAGAGTEEEPYEITNGAQLFAAVNSGASNLYFELKNDIYLNDSRNFGNTSALNNWYYSAPTFIGTLDGNGYTVYNMYSDNTKNGGNGYGPSGFITALGMGGTLKDIDISGAYCYSLQYNVAGLVGAILPVADGEDYYAQPAVITGCSVTNSYIKNTNTSKAFVGALVGWIKQDTTIGPVKLEISNCYTANNTLVTASGTNDASTCGLIAEALKYSEDGDQHTITVTDCYSDGNIPFYQMSAYNNSNIKDVYAVNLPEGIETGYAVDTYGDMTGLFEADSAWYQADNCAPRLVSRTENFKYPDLDCDGVDEAPNAASVIIFTKFLLGVKGYNLNNAVGNMNGDSAKDGTVIDIVDIRDLVILKNVLAGTATFEKKN